MKSKLAAASRKKRDDAGSKAASQDTTASNAETQDESASNAETQNITASNADMEEQVGATTARRKKEPEITTNLSQPKPAATDLALDTGIEWTHLTGSWWWGCAKVSAGCRECYAEGACKRAGRNVWGATAARLVVSSTEGKVRKANAAAGKLGCKDTVFCSSMSDFFEDRPDLVETRANAWSVIRECENLVFIVLTKRPENIAGMLPPDWGEEGYANVCLAATVEDGTERVMSRIDALRAIPARWRMLSVEPLLGPVDLHGKLQGIDWVIVGGESGKSADPVRTRPLHPDWVRQVRDACVEAEVAFFFKQWGSWSTEKPATIKLPKSVEWNGLTLYFKTADKANKVPAIIDGRKWREQPFGAEVDLERRSALSRLSIEKKESKIEAVIDPESQAEYKRLHQVILKGFDAWIEAGKAFNVIRVRKLWRAGGHASWEAYLVDLGGVSRPYANRLIQASKIYAELEDAAPIGAGSLPVLPVTESQVRALSKLPDAPARRDAWQQAVSKSDGRVPTAKVIEAVVLDVQNSNDDPPGPQTEESILPPVPEVDLTGWQGKGISVHTIGFAGKTAQQFFELLRGSGVRRVIDVRQSNSNQLAGFAKSVDLGFFLREILNIDYHCMAELAPTLKIRNSGDWQAYEPAFVELIRSREIEKRVDPGLVDGCCLLCSEPEADHCHRRLVAEYLRDRWRDNGIGVEIIHLN